MEFENVTITKLDMVDSDRHIIFSSLCDLASYDNAQSVFGHGRIACGSFYFYESSYFHFNARLVLIIVRQVYLTDSRSLAMIVDSCPAFVPVCHATRTIGV